MIKLAERYVGCISCTLAWIEQKLKEVTRS